MSDLTATPAAKSRRFQFSLWTLFIVMTLLGTGVYWVSREAAFRRARSDYEQAYIAHDAEMITTAKLCNASRQLFDAETAVPFASRSKAASAHLERIERIRKYVYIVYLQARYPPESDEPAKIKAEIDQYFADAGKLVLENR